EIVALIPQIKAKNNTIIAIVSKQDSFLAKHADTAIYVPVEKEADPLNLAPTVSTILQMAIGDALAICLMRLRNFQQQDFAVLHPGGMLGKRLTMTVGDLAHLEYPPTVYDKDAIEKVIVEISSKRLGATAVLDDAQRVCGIITDGDLRRMLQRGGDYRLCYAHQVMTGKPKIIDQNEKAGVALDMMRKHNITQLLVVEGSSANYLGVIHIHDLLREGF
ncbi:MAG: CBS domain-containing protein, partial [Saprospiraceae bacterium]|nr:CBS domain-containing protein [Saprospiraceae bacterium]